MINSPVKMLALELAEELVELVREAGPEGLSYTTAAAALDMEYSQLYSAVPFICDLGHLKVGRGANGHRNRILLPDAIEPVELALSDGQKKVLDFLCSRADENGIVQASAREIRNGTGVTSPSFCLERLDLKGYLDFADLGGPTKAAKFRVYPNGTGRKSDTWWLLKYGRVPAIEWARERGYAL